LYRGLPWTALVVGGIGVWLGGFGYVMLVVCYIVCAYGACVLTERSTYTGVYHYG